MGTSLSKLIEHVDSNLHKEYVLERYKEGLTSNVEVIRRQEQALRRLTSSLRNLCFASH